MQPTDHTSTVFGVSFCSCEFQYTHWIPLTRFRVGLEAQHNLRSTIPARSNVFGHIPCILIRVLGEASSETEIANLQFAVGIDQQIAWLQISMEHVGRVDVLQSTENLIDEGLEVRIGKWLSGANDSSQIAFHQLLVEICLIEVVRARDVHVVETCDVAVSSEMLQQLDLTQGSLCENLLAEHVGDLLDCDSFSSMAISCRADNAICALAQFFCDSVTLINDEVLIEDLEDLSACHVTHDCGCLLGEGSSRGRDSRVRCSGEAPGRLLCESRSVFVPNLDLFGAIGGCSRAFLAGSESRWPHWTLCG